MTGGVPLNHATVQQRTLAPDGAISDVDSATWVLEIEGLQDWESTGLANYLWTNRGNQVSFVLAPKSGSGKKQMSGTCIVVAPPMGGEQGDFAKFEIELPVIGEPTLGTQA